MAASCYYAYEERYQTKIEPLWELLRELRSVCGFSFMVHKDNVRTNGFAIWVRTENRFFKRWKKVLSTAHYDEVYIEGEWEKTFRELVREEQEKYWQHKAGRIGIKDCD